MGGLGYYFEQNGVASTQISLVREHTEKMRTPRALWVPFELGRPLGIPGDKAFQTRVIESALALLEFTDGPVLVDFPEEVPMLESDQQSVWVCPVSFPSPQSLTDREQPRSHEELLEEERARFAPWYDLAVERKGSTSVGSSGIAIPDLSRFISSFLTDKLPENPRPDVPLADMLVFACDDLRAYILEAATAQPGNVSSGELALWFWRDTVTGSVMLALRKHCMENDDPEFQALAYRFIPDHLATLVGSD